jgi:hypothetical protein
MGLTLTEKQVLKQDLDSLVANKLAALEVEHPAVTADIKRRATAQLLQEMGVVADIEEIAKLRAKAKRLAAHIKKRCAAMTDKLTGFGITASEYARNYYYRRDEDDDAEFSQFPPEVRDGLTKYRQTLIDKLRGDNKLTEAIDSLRSWQRAIERKITLSSSYSQVTVVMEEARAYVEAFELPEKDNGRKSRKVDVDVNSDSGA